MAGILANSASVTMVSGDTAATNTFAGFLTGEQITLSTTPTFASYSWSEAKPSAATSRSDLSAATGASVTFTPDVAGYYVITVVTNDGTTYTLTLSVTQVAQATTIEALRLSPKSDASVTAPVLGTAVYHSTDLDAPAAKDSAGTVTPLGIPTGTNISVGNLTIAGNVITDNGTTSMPLKVPVDLNAGASPVTFATIDTSADGANVSYEVTAQCVLDEDIGGADGELNQKKARSFRRRAGTLAAKASGLRVLEDGADDTDGTGLDIDASGGDIVIAIDPDSAKNFNGSLYYSVAKTVVT